MFDKLKSRYNEKKALDIPDLTESSPDFLTPVEEPDTLPLEISSQEHLLKHLMTEETEYPDDIKTVRIYLNKLQAKVKNRVDTATILKTIHSDNQLLDEPTQTTATPVEVPYLDASVEFILPTNRMVAFLCVLPPVGEGAPVDEPLILSCLEEKGIVYGINKELLDTIVSEQCYAVIYAIARGTPAVNGVNGTIMEHFSKKQEIHLVEDEKGSVDYKSLNIFQTAKAGDVICDIVSPTDGQDGFNIYGKLLKSLPGKMPSIPKGEHTSLNEDGSALISDIDGNLSFSGGVFNVTPQLTISKDVDGSTGNLDFPGDILIKGDVHKGFSVKASENIVICGMAEGASITAGKDIEIKKGMNGGGSGTLIAEGNVYSHFLEQTNVTAGGNVSSQAIVNCQIASGGSILALDGIGSIIAGSLTAYQSVEAKRIGNLSNVKTTIKIGHAVREAENEDSVSAELKKNQTILEKLSKNVVFLEQLPQIPSDKQELYKTLKQQKEIYESLVLNLSTKLTELSNKKFDYSCCHVRGDIIYGVTNVSLGYSRLTLHETTYKCNVYCTADGVLMLGTF